MKETLITLDVKTITDTTKAKQLEWDTTSSSYFNIFLSYNSRFFMSNNSNVNMNSFSKLGASTYDGEEVGDGWPFEKSSFGPLCFFCFFPGKKNLVISQSYLCHKLEVLTQCMCRYHFLLQCDNTDKVDQQIHIVYLGLW